MSRWRNRPTPLLADNPDVQSITLLFFSFRMEEGGGASELSLKIKVTKKKKKEKKRKEKKNCEIVI